MYLYTTHIKTCNNNINNYNNNNNNNNNNDNKLKMGARVRSKKRLKESRLLFSCYDASINIIVYLNILISNQL